MKNFSFIFASALTVASCSLGGVKDVTPAISLENFDTTVRAADDFYRYATGGWTENNPLRDDLARYSTFDVLRENNEVRVHELFTSLAKLNNKPGSVEQKIADLYTMGMDSVRLNQQGMEPIVDDLRAIQAIETRDQISEMLALQHLQISNPFFGLYVEVDLKNSDRNILYVAQSGISMGSREYYLEPKHEQVRVQYIKYIEDLFALAGYATQDAKRAAKSVFELELELAESFSSRVELRDLQANYNMLSTDEFKKKYNAVNWDVYSKALGLEFPDQINVGQLKQMGVANSILATYDIAKLKDYLAFNLISSATSFLSDEFGDTSFGFYGKVLSGTPQRKVRWKRASAMPNGILSDAVGQMYVNKYFPAENKTKMLALVENLQSALSTHINELDWMSTTTKAKAQEKLEGIIIKVGYPDKWEDYSDLSIDPELSYWQNMKVVSQWATKDNFADLNKKPDKTKWGMSPQTVNAYYNPTTNEICFPAAILQPPFFNPTADDAVNYGAIGVVIGHEMTHGFDDQGRQFDKHGNMVDWWEEQDAEAFNQKTQILVNQFDKIELLPGLFANGALTLGENIADQGGLRVAYTAMKNAQEGISPELIDGFTAEQRFYLAYATLWAQNIRDKELERLRNADPHSQGRERVNQTFKNIDTFYDAFSVVPGDSMYLDKAERVVIW